MANDVCSVRTVPSGRIASSKSNSSDGCTGSTSTGAPLGVFLDVDGPGGAPDFNASLFVSMDGLAYSTFHPDYGVDGAPGEGKFYSNGLDLEWLLRPDTEDMREFVADAEKLTRESMLLSTVTPVIMTGVMPAERASAMACAIVCDSMNTPISVLILSDRGSRFMEPIKE